MSSSTLRLLSALLLPVVFAFHPRVAAPAITTSTGVEAEVDGDMLLMQLPPPQSRPESPMLAQLESVVVRALVPPGTAPADIGEVMTTLVVAYVCTMGFVGTAIVFIYYPHGASAVLGILLYIFALSTMKLSVKYVFEHHSLQYPAALTAVHLGFSSLLGFVVLFWRQLRHGTPVPVPTSEEFFFRFLPIGIGFALSVGMSNMALVVADAGFLEVLSATNPLFSIAFLLFMGIPFNLRLLPPTCAVVAGCMFSAAGVQNFSAMGALLLLLGNGFRAVKVSMQQDLLPKGPGAKFDPCSVLAWTCLVCVVFMGIWSAVADGSAPLDDLRRHESQLAAVVAIGISCVNAGILNLSSLFVVRSLGAVGTQVVAQTKAALTVFGSVVLFNEVVSPVEAVGFVAVLGGSYLFARAEKQGKPAAESAPEDWAACSEKNTFFPAGGPKAPEPSAAPAL